MRYLGFFSALLLLAVAANVSAGAESGPSVVPLPKPGKEIALDAEHYFVFSFDKRPAMETIIVKVEIYAKGGAQDTSFEILGDADMPSMRGAHALGDRPFRLNKKGAYLLPVTFVMPGDWEVSFTFRKGGVLVFKGAHALDI